MVEQKIINLNTLRLQHTTHNTYRNMAKQWWKEVGDTQWNEPEMPDRHTYTYTMLARRAQAGNIHAGESEGRKRKKHYLRVSIYRCMPVLVNVAAAAVVVMCFYFWFFFLFSWRFQFSFACFMYIRAFFSPFWAFYARSQPPDKAQRRTHRFKRHNQLK